LHLLSVLAGPKSVPLMRRIAESSLVPAAVRLDARRRAGWPERGEHKRRLDFLNSLPRPETALAEFARSASFGPLAQGEVLDDILGYFQALPPARMRQVIDHLAGEPSPGAVRLLAATLHLADQPAQRRA